MAIGLSSTLHVGQIHRLPAERVKSLDNIAREASVRTLWSLLFVDGYGTPALGASFRMLWDVSKAPSYLSTLPPDATNTAAVAFESHCKLVRIKQDCLDPIYSPTFQTLSWAEKEGLFLRAYTALNSFRQTIDPCLLLTRTSRPHRTQIVLWVSYHAACISLHRRYLDPVGLQSTARSQSSLHDITAAATEITRLLQKLAVLGELAMVPSFLAYHTLRAALVHALNLTDEKGELRREAARGLRTCFSTLITLRDNSWPTLSHHILCFLRSTLASWELEVCMDTEAPRRI
ncbi:hypothetical protein PG994_014471 [Apiospora phragmitis]|uniref:Transcription factor domain-containing protein n=1 Tax=Apiospora phragmitis TaxID=2905665 RepID=A0ABR1T6G5_9PEZI